MKLWSSTTTLHRIVPKRGNTKTQVCFKTRSQFRSPRCFKKCLIKIAFKICHSPLWEIAYNNYLTGSSLLLWPRLNKKRSSSTSQTLRMIPRLNASATIKRMIISFLGALMKVAISRKRFFHNLWTKSQLVKWSLVLLKVTKFCLRWRAFLQITRLRASDLSFKTFLKESQSF